MEKAPYHTKIEPQTQDERDIQVMAYMGKRPVMAVKRHAKDTKRFTLVKRRRRLGFISILGFMCTLLVTWESIII